MSRLRTGYGTKLALSHVLLVLVVGLVVLFVIDRAIETDLLGDSDLRLEAQASGAATWVREGKHPARLAGRLSGIVSSRVTILDEAGRVLGDSEPGVELGSDEARTPEVTDALRGKVGKATRVSAGVETRFVAIPVPPGIVLRLASSLSPIMTARARVRRPLFMAAAGGVALAVLLSYVASRVAARPLRTMRDAAHRLADGDYTVSLPGRSPDEFGELERSLSVLSTRLAEDRARIERLEATRREFVANVSHELRTPTTAILGYAETLLGGGADPETARKFLETMHRQAKRMSALVTDLLALSALEARAPGHARRERAPLASIASEAVRAVREGHSGVRFSVDIPEDAVAYGDPEGIERIIENLVENAARYGASAVSVGVTGAGASMRLDVVDDGPGIPAEHLPHLFERFYRVPRATERRGTGLGLAIVKHLAESMGGSASVESTVGKGSRFSVELPGPPV